MDEATKELDRLLGELQAAVKVHREAVIAKQLAEWRYRQQRRKVVELQCEGMKRELSGNHGTVAELAR